ncbi:MAG: hypothetical protein AABO57_07795 [Acidobacteriota bacterium]
MTPEEIVERYSNRPGHRFVGYLEVGLPIYRLQVQAFTLAHKKIPPIQEFVLRTITAGLTKKAEIGTFLGLREPVIRGALVNLKLSGDLDQVISAGIRGDNWALSEKGKRTLREAIQIEPIEREFDIYYDRLLQEAALYERRETLRPLALRNSGRLEIPPVTNRRPQVADLALQDVQRIVQQALRSGEQLGDYKSDLLALKSIEKWESLFRLAVAIVFRSTDSDEPSVSFFVEGRPSPRHDSTFAQCGGVAKIERHIGRSLSGQSSEAVEARLKQLMPLLKKENLPDEHQVVLIEDEEARSAAEIEVATDRARTAITEDGKKEAEEELQTATQRLAAAQALLGEYTKWIKHLKVFHHPPILRTALEEANERLIIIAPWIRASVVDLGFLRRLVQLLQRGVRVFIGWGIAGTEDREKLGWPEDLQALEKLKQTANQFPNFQFKYLGDTHAKVLLYDRGVVVIGSFNWLSFKGDPDRTFRDEQGFLVAVPAIVDQVFDDEVARFSEQPVASRPAAPVEQIIQTPRVNTPMGSPRVSKPAKSKRGRGGKHGVLRTYIPPGAPPLPDPLKLLEQSVQKKLERDRLRQREKPEKPGKKPNNNK